MFRKIKLRSYHIVFTFDLLMIAITFIAAIIYHNRNLSVKIIFDEYLFIKALIHLSIATILWITLKLNKRIIKYYKSSDFIILVIAIFGIHTLSYLVDFFYTIKSIKLDFTAFFESFLVSAIVLISIRLVISLLYENFILYNQSSSLKKVLIYGAGERGIILYKSISNNANKKYLVTGFIDDDINKISRYINDLKIYSYNQAIDKFIKTEKVNRVIIATNKISAQQKSNLIKDLLPYKIKVKQVESTLDWYDNDFDYNKISNINIKDLMQREIIEVNNNTIKKNLYQKTAFVTGAAGSIGSELVRKLVENNCKIIVCLDINESALYGLQQELKKINGDIIIYFELVDIKDYNYLDFLFDKYRPQIVFHAAAYKHVPLMEEFPWQAIKTNIIGSWQVATISIKYKVQKFILISTDKAVKPTSLMGVSKRLAEIIIRSLSNQQQTTKFCITRFGNVLGSNGSVIPLFKEQILKGGPITITHPNMERYFMTIPEACSLVLEAFSMGKGEEIFVFDMGKPVKIKDLAYNMIRLSGYEPELEIKIEYIGIRKGEKLSEEIFGDKETFLPTHHNKIFISKEKNIDIEITSHIVNTLFKIESFNVTYINKLLHDMLKNIETEIDIEKSIIYS